MKFKSVLLLAVAIGCGLVAMLGVQQVLSGDNSEQKDNRVKVLVATKEIGPGVPLSAETNVVFQKWDPKNVPRGAVTKKEEYENRALIVRAFPEDVITKPKLSEPGEFGASAEIPNGMRVVTVPVDMTKSHSGLIMPGDRVDVMVTYDVRRNDNRVTVTKPVVQYVEVFATGSIRASMGNGEEENDAENMSLLVKPEEFMLIKHAESKGSLHLAMRARSDSAPVDLSAIDDLKFDHTVARASGLAHPEPATEKPVEQFLKQEQERIEDEEPAAPIQAATPTWNVEIFAGDQHRVEQVELPGQAAAAGQAGNPLENMMQKLFVTGG